MSQNCSLNELNPGQSAVVEELKTRGSIRRRLLDIGLVKDTKVECVGRSPAGDPAAFLIRGAVIAIRSEDLKDIVVRI
ncbi:FeoA family protein [Anaerostipes sp.]|uniref:FeoA family protein n=1 Tax=Anaerostipes sp. TaxID=1872530 RepID=UPI0025BB8EDD|nr:FeoA family protein [Anaerostipes sp.]MBS7009585.1 ferrous iron transport protein A [Anaerostipes sp.]